MRTYTLLFSRPAPSAPMRIDFDAEDPARAFSIAQRESGKGPVEVWEGKKRLGKLTPMGGELWQVD